MTRLLEHALETVRALPPEAQDAVARLLLQFAGNEEAITMALARPPRDQSPEAVTKRRARTDRLVAELAAMPVLDPRSPRAIMDDLNAL
jgi:hypothetical protein